MSYRTVLLSAVASLALASAASAHTVAISGIAGTWLNGTPAGNVVTGGGGTLNPTARWGVPQSGAGQSGYNFTGTPGTINAIVPPSPSSNFVLGGFAHINEPINAGTSITGIDLRITANVSVDGGAANALTFNYHFTHEETPNGAPCPYGPSGLTGINANGCADRVTVNALASTGSFVIGPDTYTLNIVGFQVGGVTQTEFLTMEDAVNNATLIGDVSLRSVVVAEPLSLGILGLGLVGLGAVRRRSGVSVQA